MSRGRVASSRQARHREIATWHTFSPTTPPIQLRDVSEQLSCFRNSTAAQLWDALPFSTRACRTSFSRTTRTPWE